MLLKLILYLSKHTLRIEFPTKLAWLGYFISSVLTLVVLHFTSMAIGGEFFRLNQSYFTYIVVGEVSLYIVSGLLQQAAVLVRSWHERAIFSFLLTVPANFYLIICSQLLARIPRAILFVLLQLVLASVLFDFELSLESMIVLLLYPLMAIPLFLSIGLCIIGLILIFGRGQSLIFYLFNLMSILSGAYFPLSLLPPKFQAILAFNPYSMVLEPIRQFSYHFDYNSLFLSAAGLLLIGLVSLGIGMNVIFLGVKHLKKNDRRFTYN